MSLRHCKESSIGDKLKQNLVDEAHKSTFMTKKIVDVFVSANFFSALLSPTSTTTTIKKIITETVSNKKNGKKSETENTEADAALTFFEATESSSKTTKVDFSGFRERVRK